MHSKTRFLTKAAIIAALYVVLTYAFQFMSFSQVQFRVSEALTILPLFMPAAIPGLFVGCLLANFLAGGVLIDVILGSVTTLLAALITRALRKKPLVAMAAPVVLNGLIVGPMVYFVYTMGESAFSVGALALTCLSVAFGELAVIYTLGLGLKAAMNRTGLAKKL